MTPNEVVEISFDLDTKTHFSLSDSSEIPPLCTYWGCK